MLLLLRQVLLLLVFCTLMTVVSQMLQDMVDREGKERKYQQEPNGDTLFPTLQLLPVNQQFHANTLSGRTSQIFVLLLIEIWARNMLQRNLSPSPPSPRSTNRHQYPAQSPILFALALCGNFYQWIGATFALPKLTPDDDYADNDGLGCILASMSYGKSRGSNGNTHVALYIQSSIPQPLICCTRF